MKNWTDHLKLCNSYCSEEEIKKMNKNSFIITTVISVSVLIVVLIVAFSLN